MEPLERLPNIIRLSERVVRVLGLNPNKFTLQGTNTYLIGKGPKKVLLDTGEGIPEYIPLLQEALDKEPSNEEGERATIAKVICSHWHHDHVGGIQDVLSFLAARNIQLHNPPTTAADAGSTAPTTTNTKATKGLVDIDTSISSAPTGVFKFPCPDQDDPETRFQAIQDHQVIQVDDQTTLLTLHTPGHTSDHCSFFLKEENTLFTADCVLGQGTAVFEDLGSYIRSLEKQLSFSEASVVPKSLSLREPSYKIYPGHGPIIEDGPAKIREYIKHRFERERQVIAVLTSGGSSSDVGDAGLGTSPGAGAGAGAGAGTGTGKTAMDIVKVIYKAYPVALHLPAQHQVLLHLKKLEEDGKVKRAAGGSGLVEDIEDVVWELVPQPQANL
ncbi:MAG: beta-lactamase-like protein [Linnemannia gamsii]|nr:MAG: beta-lactamase-like protein [Linnemannia gamsii]